jgi:hypothetical protein
VYDFGAGTLDLSVIKIQWAGADKRSSYPERWESLARLGVPVAGNHLDGLIARLIHDALSEYFDTPRPGLTYRYPIVAPHPILVDGKPSSEHASASLNLWLAIRAAKEGLGETETFTGLSVKVGHRGEKTVVAIEGDPDLDTRADASGGARPGLRKGATDEVFLDLPASYIQGDQRIQEFLTFVVDTVVDRCLEDAQLSPEQVDTVIVSGRGIQWPGLRSRLFARFPPPASCLDPFGAESRGRKEAVVRGAIALVDLEQFGGTEIIDRARPRLAALLEPQGDLYLEHEWDRPIPWGSNNRVRLVQLSCDRPSIREDQNSYRRHFYLDASPPFTKNSRWRDNGDLTIYATEDAARAGGQLPHSHPVRRIHLGNTRDETVNVEVIAHVAASRDAVRPPWPIGESVLSPDRIH